MNVAHPANTKTTTNCTSQTQTLRKLDGGVVGTVIVPEVVGRHLLFWLTHGKA